MITIKHKKTGRVEVLTEEQYDTLTDVIGTSAAFTVIQDRDAKILKQKMKPEPETLKPEPGNVEEESGSIEN